MISQDRRVRIITGHYGSGKTEFAVNYVAALSKISKRVALSDLDIVNVYFRSRERREELAAMGVKLISSSIHGDSADIPAVSAEMVGPAKDNTYDYVIDLGGNDVGTMVLGRLKPILKPAEVDFFMVVNGNRPATCTVEGIIAQKEQLEFSSGYPVTGFINNTNLIRESTAENMLFGNALLLEASKKTNVPIKYLTYVEECLHEPLPEGLEGEIFPLKFFMRKTWM